MPNQNGYQNSTTRIPAPWWGIPDDISNAVPLIQAASQMHYHRTTVFRKVLKGEIKGFKIGHLWYVIVPPVGH